MAERRRTGATSSPVRPRTRRRPPRDEREVVEEDAPEAVDRDEQEPLDEDEQEPLDDEDEQEPLDDEDEQELLDEDEPEPAGRGRDGNGRAGRRRDSDLTAREAARAALRQVVELTGKDAESITDVDRTEEGWTIGVEVVEDSRIPSSADILATYEARIDEDGELMSYRRTRRYPRGRGDC